MDELVEQDEARAQEKQLHAVLQEENKTIDQTSEVDPAPDRTRELRTPGFSRMRTTWGSPEEKQIAALRDSIDDLMFEAFADAFALMWDIYDIVREPLLDDAGNPRTTRSGVPLYAKNENGAYIEDYSRLGHKQRDDLLLRITTYSFQWQQRAADMWGDAMMAKAVWEERFSDAFLSTPGGRPTIDDKTNHARSSAVDERYFSIYQSWVSRRADALVRSMELIGLRLKDTLPR